MRILSFPNFVKNRTETGPSDWTQQEIADFYRAHRLLVENGAGIGIDRGLSDIGEPWMAFYDVATQDVFMHVARIGNRCILVCDQLDINLKAANISTLISDFEQSVRHHLSVRTQRNSNIVIHPAARIIMSISMVFLLFKLDNSQAYAKGTAEARTTAVDANATRIGHNSDNTAAHRAQGAFTRMLENAETPASVAVLAGMILAGELAANAPSAKEMSHQDATAVAVRDMGIGQPVETSADASARLFKTGETLDASRNDSSAMARIAMDEEVAALLAPIISSTAAGGEAAVSLVKMLIDQLAAEDNQTIDAKILSAGLDIPHALVSASNGPVLVAAAQGTIDAEQASQAMQTIASIFSWLAVTENTGDIVASSFISPSITPGAKPAIEKAAVETPAIKQISDISLAALEAIDDHAGFFLRTTMMDTKLRDALSHVIGTLGNCEVEYLGGRVLIEQTNIAAFSDRDIGLWTNIMADGSSISIVGQASIVDDITSFLI